MEGESIGQQLRDLNTDIKAFGGALGELNTAVGKMSVHLEHMDRQISDIKTLNERVSRLEEKAQANEGRAVANRWLIAVGASVFLGLLSILAAHMQWK